MCARERAWGISLDGGEEVVAFRRCASSGTARVVFVSSVCTSLAGCLPLLDCCVLCCVVEVAGRALAGLRVRERARAGRGLVCSVQSLAGLWRPGWS